LLHYYANYKVTQHRATSFKTDFGKFCGLIYGSGLYYLKKQ